MSHVMHNVETSEQIAHFLPAVSKGPESLIIQWDAHSQAKLCTIRGAKHIMLLGQTGKSHVCIHPLATFGYCSDWYWFVLSFPVGIT